ncbi:MAG: TetR family transcriptional regulator [Acidimicrobiales bacterium]
MIEHMAEADAGSGWDRRRKVRLTEYERLALGMFADRGFKDVTFDELADAAGVSARTLFRYFPTKEEFLLAFPRRGVAAAVETIASLEPSDSPLETAWKRLLEFSSESVLDVELLTLWRRAALEAPDVVAQVRGERVQALVDALTDYCARSLDTDPASDVRPRLLAGIIAGGELALIETLSRSELTAPEVFSAVEQAMRMLEGPTKAGGA